jgi:hypothetical protein
VNDPVTIERSELNKLIEMLAERHITVMSLLYNPSHAVYQSQSTSGKVTTTLRQYGVNVDDKIEQKMIGDIEEIKQR